MEGQCGCASEVVLPPKRSPWGRAPGVAPQPCSLAAVMDEELARELQSKEGGVSAVVEAFGSVSDAFHCEEARNTPDEDLLLAQMLQLEFDRESDLHLAAQERHVNGDSKGGWAPGPSHTTDSVAQHNNNDTIHKHSGHAKTLEWASVIVRIRVRYTINDSVALCTRGGACVRVSCVH